MKKFEKWQGCGNDFIIFDCRNNSEIDDEKKISQICDRHFGIGADGVIYILNSKIADVRMRIFNSDGSEAEMCGNGIRCFTKFLLDGKAKKKLKVETGAGILTVKIIGENVTVDMGEPILDAKKIPVVGYENKKIIGEEIEVDGKIYKMTCVSMGNPHCVVFLKNIDEVELEKIGPMFEKNKKFPKHTNAEFVQVIGENKLRMRVWERGSGITLACGTGACATAVAANLNNFSGKSSEVQLDGGNLKIEWKEDNHIYMTGAAEKIFSGQIDF